MKKVNLMAQRLSEKIGALVLINEKQNTKLTYKGIFDITTNIQVVDFSKLDDKTLFMLTNFVERKKKGIA